MKIIKHALVAVLLAAPVVAYAESPALLFADRLLRNEYHKEKNTGDVPWVGLSARRNLSDVWLTVRISADTRTIILPQKVVCAIIRHGQVLEDYAAHAVADGQGIKLYFPYIEEGESIRFGVAFEDWRHFAERVSITLESAQGGDFKEWSLQSQTDKPGLQPLRMVMEDAKTCTLL